MLVVILQIILHIYITYQWKYLKSNLTKINTI